MTTARAPGRPKKELGLMFANVCRTNGSLYLVGFHDGTVKVGFSDNPRSRLQAMASVTRRDLGLNVVCFHVYAGIGNAVKTFPRCRYTGANARALEALCIRALRAVATPLAPFTEYFQGISFDAAKAVVDAEISKVGA